MIDAERLIELIGRMALPLNSCERVFLEGYDYALQEVLLKDCLIINIDKLTHLEVIHFTIGYSMGQAQNDLEEEEFKPVVKRNDNIH